MKYQINIKMKDGSAINTEALECRLVTPLNYVEFYTKEDGWTNIPLTEIKEITIKVN